MKKNSIIIAAMAVLAVLLTACNGQDAKKNLGATVKVSADKGFENSKANLNLTLSAATALDVVVTLSVDESAEGAVKAADLQFENPVTIKAGETGKTVEVTLAKEYPATAKATFKIAAAQGAVADASVAVLGVNGQTYSGDDEPQQGDDDDDITPGLQSNWSVALVGEPMYDEDEEEYYIQVSINAPGIKYYYLEENTQADLDEWYEGTVQGLIGSWEADNLEKIEDGAAITEICYDPGNDQDIPYITIFNPGVQTTIYLVEFNEDGTATGRYGATVVTLPEIEEEEVEPSDIPELALQSSWSMELDGKPYWESGYAYYDLKVSAEGIGYFSIAAFNDATIESYSLEYIFSYIQSMEQQYYGMYLQELGGKYPPYCQYDGPGKYNVYIIEFDDDVNITGRYGVSVIDVPEIEGGPLGDVELSLQSNWSVSPVGEPYYYGSYAYLDLNVTAPGIQYFWMLEATDADIAEYYDTLEGMFAYYNPTDLDYLFTLEDEEFYVSLSNNGIASYIYIIEHDADGYVTGRYSKTAVNIPAYEEAAGGASYNMARFKNATKSSVQKKARRAQMVFTEKQSPASKKHALIRRAK